MKRNDAARDCVNSVYHGFNTDCGTRVKNFSAPVVSRPVESQNFIRLKTNAEKGDGYWDVARMNAGMLICLADCSYTDQFDYVVTPPKNMLSLRMLVSGEIEMLGDTGGSTHIKCGAASITSVPGNSPHELRILERDRFASLTIHLHADSLAGLMGLGRSELPFLLSQFDDLESTFKSMSMPLTLAMTNGVTDMLKAPYVGALRNRYFEAKTMELLCLFVDAMQRRDADKEKTLQPSIQAVARAQLARRVLEKHIAAPPTVEQLARRIGVNRTQLRRDFKNFHGVTISEFIQSQRMELAKQLLRSGSVSVSVVAETVGYRHATNFGAAFRRHLGVSPKKFMQLNGKLPH